MTKSIITTIPQIPMVSFEMNPEKIQGILDAHPVADIPKDLSVKENYDRVVLAIRAHREARGELKAEHKKWKKPFWDAGKTCDNLSLKMSGKRPRRTTTTRKPRRRVRLKRRR